MGQYDSAKRQVVETARLLVEKGYLIATGAGSGAQAMGRPLQQGY
jgi:hypothetical protein